MTGFPISFDPAGASDVASGAAGLSDSIPGIGELLALGFTLPDILSGNFGALIDPFGIFGLEGVPKGAKTAGAASSLESSGDPLSADLGRFIANAGGGKGSNVLSNPAFAHETNSMADVLTWLTGKALPGWKAMGSTGEIAGIPPPPGAPYSKDVNIMGVQSPEQMAAILGKSPNLTPEQIQTILPQLINLAKSPGSVASMKGAIDPLVASAETKPTGVPLGSLQEFMNQGQGQKDQPTIPFNPLSLLPLLFGLDFGSSNSDTTNNTTNNSTTNNIMQALGMPGAAVGYNRVTAPNFGR